MKNLRFLPHILLLLLAVGLFSDIKYPVIYNDVLLGLIFVFSTGSYAYRLKVYLSRKIDYDLVLKPHFRWYNAQVYNLVFHSCILVLFILESVYKKQDIYFLSISALILYVNVAIYKIVIWIINPDILFIKGNVLIINKEDLLEIDLKEVREINFVLRSKELLIYTMSEQRQSIEVKYYTDKEIESLIELIIKTSKHNLELPYNYQSYLRDKSRVIL